MPADMSAKVLAFLPPMVRQWLIDHEAWVIGSAVDWCLRGGGGKRPRDIDILVPPKNWQAACRTITTTGVHSVHFRLTIFGGLKFKIDDVEVDVWPQHIEELLAMHAGTKVCRKAVRFSPFTVINVRYE